MSCARFDLGEARQAGLSHAVLRVFGRLNDAGSPPRNARMMGMSRAAKTGGRGRARVREPIRPSPELMGCRRPRWCSRSCRCSHSFGSSRLSGLPAQGQPLKGQWVRFFHPEPKTPGGFSSRTENPLGDVHPRGMTCHLAGAYARAELCRAAANNNHISAKGHRDGSLPRNQ